MLHRLYWSIPRPRHVFTQVDAESQVAWVIVEGNSGPSTCPAREWPVIRFIFDANSGKLLNIESLVGKGF